MRDWKTRNSASPIQLSPSLIASTAESCPQTPVKQILGEAGSRLVTLSVERMPPLNTVPATSQLKSAQRIRFWMHQGLLSVTILQGNTAQQRPEKLWYVWTIPERRLVGR